ncbi:hypothetical protein V8E36_009113 [Tilletia maclaganii]
MSLQGTTATSNCATPPTGCHPAPPEPASASSRVNSTIISSQAPAPVDHRLTYIDRPTPCYPNVRPHATGPINCKGKARRGGKEGGGRSTARNGQRRIEHHQQNPTSTSRRSRRRRRRSRTISRPGDRAAAGEETHGRTLLRDRNSVRGHETILSRRDQFECCSKWALSSSIRARQGRRETERYEVVQTDGCGRSEVATGLSSTRPMPQVRRPSNQAHPIGRRRKQASSKGSVDPTENLRLRFGSLENTPHKVCSRRSRKIEKASSRMGTTTPTPDSDARERASEVGRSLALFLHLATASPSPSQPRPAPR